MPKITFYPLGNADSVLLDLAGGEKVLFDFGDEHNADDKSDLRIDLTQAIRDNLADAQKDAIDVVAFTHLDRDHICGATALFWLNHAAKYQGADRIRIDEMWVPAAAIVDDACEDEATVLQAEARHRLKAGKGIRVFSRPDVLKDWLGKQGLTVSDRSNCIVDAGTLVPTFSLAKHGVEFFVHSPFGHRLNETEVVERNRDSIVVQATFEVQGQQTKVMLGSDVKWDHLQDIVAITRAHGRKARLQWDVFKLPHHCSYLSLAEEKGTDKTIPVEEIAWLYEANGNAGGIIVSTSWPIPLAGDDVQPPHRQAANYFKGLAGRKFVVTMEHPSSGNPKPLVIIIDHTKARVEGALAGGMSFVTSQSTPRAG